MKFSYLKVALDRKDWQEVSRVRKQLDLMFKKDVWGFVVQSRFQQNAEEERASLFHAGRELKNSRNSILQLKTQSGMLTGQEDIEGEVIVPCPWMSGPVYG